MSLTVLNVAYPLAPVGLDAAGGAEQILARLDEALVEHGHQSLVVACEDSKVRGTLLAVPKSSGELGETARRAAWKECRARITQALKEWPVQVVHLHGVDFHQYLPAPGPPALVTLHLPPDWYPAEIFKMWRPSTFLHCVSASQQARCPDSAVMLPPIENGVPEDFLRARHAKRNYAFALGRICPEKGFHFALEAARRAGIPLVLAGQVFRYPVHEDYFRREISPRLDRTRRFIGPVGCKRKRRLLAAARCVLIPSQAPETSSLVALEALACGTPVVAFPSGALPEIIEHGRTGFLVKDAGEMAEAIPAAAGLSPEACRAGVRARFGLRRMTGKYLEIYERMAESNFVSRRAFEGSSVYHTGSCSTGGDH